MAGPAFILATDLGPTDAAWASMGAMAAGLHEFAARALGAGPRVGLARLPARSVEDAGEFQVGRVIDRCIGDGAPAVFVLPAAFELNLWQRATLGEELAAARRRHPSSWSTASSAGSSGRWRGGASRPSGPGSCSWPTARATPPPAPTPTG
jgi:hypothetical protein